ncbi:MAG: BPSL0067 family protein [Massilia sp.]
MDHLEGRKPFGDGECVALPQAVTTLGHTSGWRPGPRVVDLSYLNPGTVIANFVFDAAGRGRFPNRHGYHAALFVEFGPRSQSTGRPMSIVMMDQWKNRKPTNTVHARTVGARGDRNPGQGNPYADADNADKFYVVVR